MRLKLSISVPHGDELKEVFVVQQSAHTIGDVLASVADEFGLQNGESVAAFTLDGFHLGRNLEAWRCLEKDMVLKIRQVGGGAEKASKRQSEEAKSVGEQSELQEEAKKERKAVEEEGGAEQGERQSKAVFRQGGSAGMEEVPSVEKRMVQGAGLKAENVEQDAEQGAEQSVEQGAVQGVEQGAVQGDRQEWSRLPSPRPKGEVETRRCSECAMRGSVEAFGEQQWWNPRRCCGSCWARRRRQESVSRERAKEKVVSEEEYWREKRDAWYEEISREEEEMREQEEEHEEEVREEDCQQRAEVEEKEKGEQEEQSGDTNSEEDEEDEEEKEAQVEVRVDSDGDELVEIVPGYWGKAEVGSEDRSKKGRHEREMREEEVSPEEGGEEREKVVEVESARKEPTAGGTFTVSLEVEEKRREERKEARDEKRRIREERRCERWRRWLPYAHGL